MAKEKNTEKIAELKKEVEQLSGDIKEVEAVIKVLTYEMENVNNQTKNTSKITIEKDFVGNRSNKIKGNEIDSLKMELNKYNSKIEDVIRKLESKKKMLNGSIASKKEEISTLE